MMRSLYAAVSGLKSHQQRMDVIGNNIANVNTPGFKRSRVTFEDMLYQTMRGASRPVPGGRGGTNPMQIGPGVAIGSIDTIFDGNTLQDTGKNTDLGISGDGFFCVSDGHRTFYTRAGNFNFDQEGNLVSALNGMRVMGWQAANGMINTNIAPGLINIPTLGVNISAHATTKASYAGNLSSNANGSIKFTNGTNTSNFAIAAGAATANLQLTLTPSNSFNTWNYAITSNDPAVTINNGSGTVTLDGSGKIAAISGGSATIKINGNEVTFSLPTIGNDLNPTNYTVTGGTMTTPPENVSFTPADSKTTRQTVYDSRGNEYTVTVNFTRASDNSWNWSSSVSKATAGGSIDIPLVAGSGNGQITFSSTGQFSLATGSTKISFDPGNGAAQVDITPDFSGLTEYSSESDAAASSQDGYQAGSLESITFDTTGTIVGVFSNGVSQPLAQVALARFANPAGLLKDGSSIFSASSNSGNPVLGTAGKGGLGSIKPGSLEASNVDLSSEFTDLIVTERGFQANSKVITTSDEMLQDLVNLKR